MQRSGGVEGVRVWGSEVAHPQGGTPVTGTAAASGVEAPIVEDVPAGPEAKVS